jgi:hypothetical protein
MEATCTAQLDAQRANTKAVSDWNTALATAQTNETGGRPYPPLPAKPSKVVVGDGYIRPDQSVAPGTVTMVPFVPPLGDLVLRHETPSGSIKTDTPDTQAAMYNMLLSLMRSQSLLVAQLQAITAKLGA